MDMPELIAAVKDHAIERYTEGGWDYVVEAYSDHDLAFVIGNARTVAGAIRRVAKEVGIRDEVRQDIINS